MRRLTGTWRSSLRADGCVLGCRGDQGRPCALAIQAAGALGGGVDIRAAGGDPCAQRLAELSAALGASRHAGAHNGDAAGGLCAVAGGATAETLGHRLARGRGVSACVPDHCGIDGADGMGADGVPVHRYATPCPVVADGAGDWRAGGGVLFGGHGAEGRRDAAGACWRDVWCPRCSGWRCW